ncbi:MAG: hypothetical protein E6J78_19715 [Deltaproteobacteria bacterium]|nr:MAG: hypothetical protein E6J78_19715 [Deltaproteobacteria bacterium]
MFARIVSMQLKPNKSSDFHQLFEKKLLPVLRKQKGFKDEMLFEVAGGPEVMAISIWESREHAEDYARDAYPAVLEDIEGMIEKTPAVKTYLLAYSTFHKWRGPAMFPAQSPNMTPAPGVGGG